MKGWQASNLFNKQFLWLKIVVNGFVHKLSHTVLRFCWTNLISYCVTFSNDEKFRMHLQNFIKPYVIYDFPPNKWFLIVAQTFTSVWHHSKINPKSFQPKLNFSITFINDRQIPKHPDINSIFNNSQSSLNFNLNLTSFGDPKTFILNIKSL